MHVALRLLFIEQTLDVPVPQERIVPMDVPQVIKQLLEVTMSSSQDRILQSTREQILEVPVPQMMERFVAVPKIVVQHRIRQRPLTSGSLTFQLCRWWRSLSSSFLSGQGSTAFS